MVSDTASPSRGLNEALEQLPLFPPLWSGGRIQASGLGGGGGVVENPEPT